MLDGQRSPPLPGEDCYNCRVPLPPLRPDGQRPSPPCPDRNILLHPRVTPFDRCRWVWIRYYRNRMLTLVTLKSRNLSFAFSMACGTLSASISSVRIRGWVCSGWAAAVPSGPLKVSSTTYLMFGCPYFIPHRAL